MQEESLLQVVPGGGSCRRPGALSTARGSALAPCPRTERSAGHCSPAGLPGCRKCLAPQPARMAFWGSGRLCCGEELLALPGLD